MAGIYIHIPYCKQKCTYCNFHFSTNTKSINEMIDAMIIEISQRKDYLKEKNVDTIYFGGGTPSIIEAKYIDLILSKIYSIYDVKKNAEITLELNPDDITNQKIKEYKASGINRLSIGIQSFNDTDLKFMNRGHNAKQALESIRLAQENGIENITIDLIYGVPGLTNKLWENNLSIINELDINHFSAYALTVEPKTKLDYLIKTKKISPLKDKEIEGHFKILQDKVETMGYTQYEISNFCKDNHFSEHNSSYWKGKWYLGIGPSAHSFNGEYRQWNIKSNSKYISNIKNKLKYYEIESLSKKEKYNEYVLTSLRTIWGVDLKYLKENFDSKTNKHFEKLIQKWELNQNVMTKNNCKVLTKDGMLFADAISSDLFII